MKTVVGLLMLLTVAGGLAACSPRQYIQQPNNVEEIRDNVRTLKASQDELARRMSEVEQALRSDQDRQNERDVSLRADINTLTESLQRIAERLDDLSQQLERRARTAPPPSLYPNPVTPPVEPAPSGDATSPPAPAAPPGGEAGELYDRAYRDVTRGNLAMAQQGFEEFLRSYPKDDLADNAQYWLGECHYAQDQLPEAAREFEKVLSDYPDGDKGPAAYLKLGYCALRQSDTAKARRWFDDLIRKYPSSEEARAARNKLSTLN